MAIKPTLGAEKSAAPQTDDTSMNVPTNSAPSSFVISKSSPFTRPLLRAAHHDIKPSPMTTLLNRLPHVARARNVAPHCHWRSDEVLSDFPILGQIDILP